MNKSVIALNITSKGLLLNNDLVPILLYTSDVTQSIENIFNINLDIGNNLYKYIYENFIKVNDEISIERYCNIKINCIFFDSIKKTHINVCKMLQDIHPLSVDTDKNIVEMIGKHILQSMAKNMDETLINESLNTLGLIEKNKTVIINYLKDLKK